MASGKRGRAASDIDAENRAASSTTPSGTRSQAITQSRRIRHHLAAGDAGSDFVPSDEGNEYENEECEDEGMPFERDALETQEKKKYPGGDLSEGVAAAVPCHGGYAWTRTYDTASQNRFGLAAYVGSNDIASMHRDILSAAFLPAFAIFQDSGVVHFKKTVHVLQDPARRDEREDILSDLFLAFEKRQTNGDEETDKVGDAVQWLVGRSARVKDWSQEQQDNALDHARKALRKHYHDIDAIPMTYLRTESALPQWQHPQDPLPEVEQYNRTVQLLRYCMRAGHSGPNKRKGQNWTDFWKNDNILKSRSVSSILIPSWMQEQSDGQMNIASTEGDEEEHCSSDQTDTNARTHEQAQGNEIMEGTQEGQPLEQITRDEATEQECQLDEMIRGGDFTTAIEILDSDEDLVQDHQLKVEVKAEDLTTSLETIEEVAQLPLKPACHLSYITDRELSRDLCTNVEWFDICWDQMERRDPLPNNVIVTADPRNSSCDKEWRDAIRQELRLGTPWRRRNNNGLALKLMALRIEAAGEKLDCYDPDPEASDYNCTHEEVVDFVDRHEECQIQYYVDFFTNEEIESGRANDFEIPNVTGNA